MSIFLTTEQKVHAAYMGMCPPSEAYAWLKSQAPSTAAEAKGGWWLGHPYRLSEYLLLRRKDPTIDLALAMYGRNPHTVRSVYRRGGAAARTATWSNLNEGPFSPAGIWCDKQDLAALVASGTLSEMMSFASNPSLSDGAIESIVTRKECFEELVDRRWRFLLLGLAKNSRLLQKYNDVGQEDGYAEYLHGRVFTVVWKLAELVPADQDWGSIVQLLLKNCLLPEGMKNKAPELIARWRIDPPRKPDDKSYHPGNGFMLRSRLADLLDANAELRDNDDLALQQSYFGRFDPVTDPGWDFAVRSDFATPDPNSNLDAALRNVNVWKTEADRQKLWSLCLEAPDPFGDGYHASDFRGNMTEMECKHPDFFKARDQNTY